MRAINASVILGVLLVACGTEALPAEPSSSSSAPSPVSMGVPSPTEAAPTKASPAPPRPIPVGELPAEGIAVDLGRNVVLLDPDGTFLTRIQGSSLYYQWTVPGDVVLRQDERFFVLRVDRGVLRPLHRDAASDLDPQFQSHVGLPEPAGVIAGRWAYALPGPGGLVLAQWSGECEVPVAMFVPPGGPPLSVTGDRSISGPNSRALGWDARGRALVELQEGPCGTSFERPGIYAFTAPGVGELVYRGRFEGARMWGAEP
jgi:hypothetical protein